MKMKTAIPLITADPFLSIWSCSDNLHDEPTRHWSGKASPIMAAVRHKGGLYYLAGMEQESIQLSNKVRQTGLKITPLSTEYTFENKLFKVTLTFTTPLLLDRLDILSRPVGYVEYSILMKEETAEDTAFLFGVNARSCVNNNKQKVTFKRSASSVCVGNVNQMPLAQSDDGCICDWGYLHIADSKAKAAFLKDNYLTYTPLNQEYNGKKDMPYLISESCKLSGVVTIGFNEIYAIEYFGEQIKEVFFEHFSTFEEMLQRAHTEYARIKELCNSFDNKFLKDTEHLGKKHQKILVLAYRQAISAHKLIKDHKGQWIFLSKENRSNGCIGTLDVTYPSIPLFLKYNPELVMGMLRPILKYAESDAWEFQFCPHDVGQYPLANGQVYGNNLEKYQMPIEECGNMLICLAAVRKYKNGDSLLFEQHSSILKQWADYLVKFGYNPGNQLCTDDFAGHLDHNCNLSLKAILGIAAYSLLSGDNAYMDIAREYANNWEIDAKNEKATRLTFDNENGWSIKYNMVWDKLLDLNLFSEETKKREVALYKEKCNRYGVPLDSRNTYTKIDWLVWSTHLTEDKEYFELVNSSIVNMIEETQDRVPLADLYDTAFAERYSFQARSVVGGLYIHLLD